MNNKKGLIILFVIIAIIQLLVPAKMIWNKESTLIYGKPYKFKTAPIDPTDPFIGKYIILDFDANSYEANEQYIRGEIVYVYLEEDKNGFAKIAKVSKSILPDEEKDYIKAKVRFGNYLGYDLKIQIDYPFQRFYMEESKAYNAELLYRKFQNEPDSITYALIRVKNGDAVIQNVFINDTPIKELVEINY